MKFKTFEDAKKYGLSIGATHYKNQNDDYYFVKACGQIHPIIEPQNIRKYMSIDCPSIRIIFLAKSYQQKADLLWFEEWGKWFAHTCAWSFSGLLRDDDSVKLLQ